MNIAVLEINLPQWLEIHPMEVILILLLKVKCFHSSHLALHQQVSAIQENLLALILQDRWNMGIMTCI